MNGMIVQPLINRRRYFIFFFLYIELVKTYYDIYAVFEEIRLSKLDNNEIKIFVFDSVQ